MFKKVIKLKYNRKYRERQKERRRRRNLEYSVVEYSNRFYESS